MHAYFQTLKAMVIFFIYLIGINLLFPHVMSLLEVHAEMIGPLYFRVKTWEPKVEPLEVNRILWLFIKVKIPNAFS